MTTSRPWWKRWVIYHPRLSRRCWSTSMRHFSMTGNSLKLARFSDVILTRTIHTSGSKSITLKPITLHPFVIHLREVSDESQPTVGGASCRWGIGTFNKTEAGLVTISDDGSHLSNLWTE